MNSVRELSHEEYAEYEEWAYLNENELEFNYEVQYHEAGYIYIKIFETDDKIIGLVCTDYKRNGWEFLDKDGFELAYDVIANHENEYVRSAIASFWLPESFEIAQYKRKGPAPYRILKRLAEDESAIVRTSVTWSQGITREILDMLAMDPEEMVREAVACNPLTPPMTLEVLSADRSLRVLESLSTNPNIPSDVASRISSIDSGILKRNLASNPATPPETIRTLLAEAEGFSEAHKGTVELSNGFRVMNADASHDFTIREKIAENPNTPRDLLLELSRRSTTVKLLVSLCKNPNTPQEAIIMIAERTAGTRSSQPDWPKALLDNPLLPPSYFERFANTTSTTIRRLVRDNPRTPESLRIRLSYDPDLAKGERYHPEPKKPRFPETDEPKSIIELYSLSQNGSDRALAAGAPNVPYGILERLSLDKSASVRAAVASNKYIGEDLLLQLCDDNDERVRVSVAANPCATAKTIERLLRDKSESVLVQLAKRHDLSPAILKGFAESDSVAVRCAVANNESTPHEILSFLLTDVAPAVRTRLATRNDLPESDYEFLIGRELGHDAKDGGSGIDTKARPNRNIIVSLMDKMPLSDLTQTELLQIGGYDIKRKLAERTDAPLSIVARLAEDNEYLIREITAKSPLLSRESAQKLAADKEVVVRIALSENLHVDQATLRELADDESGYVRRGAIQNPNIEESLLLEKAESAIEWERGSAANNPKLPYSVLEALSRDDSELVREAVASSPNLSVQNLVRLSEDQSDRVRASAAKNRNLPIETMVRLAGDESTRVTASLMAREELAEDVSRALVHKRPTYAISLYLRYGKTFGIDLSEALEGIEDIRILIKLAKCEDLPEAIMLRLFEFDDNRIRESLINNPNMPYVTVKSEPEEELAYGFESVYYDDIPF